MWRETVAVQRLCLVFACFMASHVTSALPTNLLRHHRHRHRHDQVRSRQMTPSVDASPRFDTEVPPFATERVVFAERPPTSPPWFVDRSTASAIADLLSRPTTDDDNRTTSAPPRDSDKIHHTGRHRRSATATDQYATLLSHPTLLQKVCDSVTEWVQRFEAEDMWGNTVRVVQEIDNGSSRVNQYFYETRCSSANRGNGLPPACYGIDSAQYESICYQNHVWAYAKVAEYSRSGDGWTLVKLRASCNCGLVLRSSLRHPQRLGMLHDIAG